MARRKTDSASKRRARRLAHRSTLVKEVPFAYDNGAGTTPHVIECEQCGRRYPGGEMNGMKDKPCVCGHEYARIVA